MCRFITYFPRERVELPPTTCTRVSRGGRRLRVAVAIGTSQNVRKQYFQAKQTRKIQNVWRDVVRPSRCIAFAIARFLVIIIINRCVVMCIAVGSDNRSTSRHHRNVTQTSRLRHAEHLQVEMLTMHCHCLKACGWGRCPS